MTAVDIVVASGLYVFLGFCFGLIHELTDTRAMRWVGRHKDEAELAACIVLVIGWPVPLVIGAFRCAVDIFVILRQVPAALAYVGRGFAQLLGFKRKASLPKARVIE